MLRKVTTPIIILLFLVVIVPFFYLFSFSLSVEREAPQPVAYELPYPGIMKDNPLYIFKTIRDRVLEFSTRDNLKKAQLRVLFSDKGVRAAELLQKNGHDEQVVTELQTSQSYFKKAIRDVVLSKQQGVSASAELVNKMKLSNLKHREVILHLNQVLSSDERKGLEPILKENAKLRDALKNI